MTPSCTPAGRGRRTRRGGRVRAPAVPFTRRAGRRGRAPRRGRGCRARRARAPRAGHLGVGAPRTRGRPSAGSVTSSATPRPSRWSRNAHQPRIGSDAASRGRSSEPRPASVVAGVGDDVGPPRQGGRRLGASHSWSICCRPMSSTWMPQGSTRPPGARGRAGAARRSGPAAASPSPAAPLRSRWPAPGPWSSSRRPRSIASSTLAVRGDSVAGTCVVDHLEDRAHRGAQPLGAAVPGRGVVGHDALAGRPVVEDVAQHPVPPRPDAR